MTKLTNKLLIVVIASALAVGCSSTQEVALKDNQVKTVKRNIVTMDLKTGDIVN